MTERRAASRARRCREGSRQHVTVKNWCSVVLPRGNVLSGDNVSPGSSTNEWRLATCQTRASRCVRCHGIGFAFFNSPKQTAATDSSQTS